MKPQSLPSVAIPNSENGGQASGSSYSGLSYGAPVSDPDSISSSTTYHSAVPFLEDSSDNSWTSSTTIMVKEEAGIISEQGYCQHDCISDRDDVDDSLSIDPLSDPYSDPFSIEEPPSYEESVGEDWNANLTWPNTLASRDELAQIFRLNNFDYSTRGRAFTVSGPPETQLPRYRNIINYFENSLDNVSSVAWSGGGSAGGAGSLQSSRMQLQSSYPGSEIETNILNRNGPKPHNIGARTSSKDIIHWEYINEINPTTATRFTVRLVPNTDEHPPNYSISDHSQTASGLSDCRPCSTIGTCDINVNDTARHSSITGGHILAKRSSLKHQPSAPSIDRVDELDSSTTSLPHESAIFRASTAPARLEKDDLCFDPPSPEIDENKSVSFFLGNKETTDTELEVQDKKEGQARVYPGINFNTYEKNETMTSETGDSGYDDESYLITDIPPPLKFADVKRESYTVRIEADSGKARLVSEPAPLPSTEEWENHRLFRYQKPQRKLSWKFWFGLVFFLCDILMILTGALLLIVNYHDNLIPGFVLLGLGIGMCIPALNYLGGFPTVCARIEGSANVFL